MQTRRGRICLYKHSGAFTDILIFTDKHSRPFRHCPGIHIRTTPLHTQRNNRGCLQMRLRNTVGRVNRPGWGAWGRAGRRWRRSMPTLCRGSLPWHHFVFLQNSVDSLTPPRKRFTRKHRSAGTPWQFPKGQFRNRHKNFGDFKL